LLALSRGWSLIPVHPNSKKPKGEWKLAQTQRANREQVEAMFETPGANYGIVTGKMSGSAVLDIDPRAGGIDSVRDIFGEEWPVTPTLQTPGEGYHLYFRYPDYGVRNSAGTIGAGLDVRGEGGCVVGAGSVRDGRLYRWVDGLSPEEVPLAPFPESLITQGNSPQDEPVSTKVDGLIPKGQRHNALVQLAGRLRAVGLEALAITAGLQVHNSTYCSPPLTEDEVNSIGMSVGKYESRATSTFRFEKPSEWLHEPERRTQWVIEDILPSGSLTMISSPMKAGKSTFARHMALSIAQGTPFLDRNVQQGLVLYLAIEEPREMVRAAFRKLGISEDTPLEIHNGSVPQKDGDKDLRAIVMNKKPAAVFIDTVGRMRNGRIEFNDYGQTMTWLEPFMYMAHEQGTAVVLLYHDNKSGRKSVGYEGMFSILGSMGIGATVDQLISVRRNSSDNRRSFFTVGRYGDIEETLLDFDSETERVDVIGTSREVKLLDVKSQVLSLINDGADEGTTRSDILNGVEGASTTIGQALTALEQEGSIVKEGDGKRGAPFHFYSVILT
tara:strand:- start:7797 stop:9461 length:1665 start_codon:yes stop_codon:yes gene_type:complete